MATVDPMSFIISDHEGPGDQSLDRSPVYTTTCDKKTIFCFFDLPPELRNLIYSMATTTTTHSQCPDIDDTAQWVVENNYWPPARLVSRRFKAEYEQEVFQIMRCCSDLTYAKYALFEKSAPDTRHIVKFLRHVDVQVSLIDKGSEMTNSKIALCPLSKRFSLTETSQNGVCVLWTRSSKTSEDSQAYYKTSEPFTCRF